ncbi:cytochrome c [Dyella lipolytica]|uniref:Cytochrome C n=1 Tax=Dyella lipolytica TaxID=1867835 RepID=A0ABW8IS36_9GAMM|nr:cytochrome C [Dyella lipolytica]GLQ47151.1 cytochrome c [Dyella lipolytica]
MSHSLNRRSMRRTHRVYLWLAVAALLLFASTSVQATPAYARQTGNACADCHAGAYGPALTPYGMRFKLNGYTDTDGNGFKIPVAVQLIGTHSVPARGQNTTQLTEADIYVAGRISDNIGGYVKIETDNDGQDHFSTKLSNVDLRFVAKDLKLGSKEATFGVSVNNSPGFEDAVSDLPDSTLLGPPGVTGTLLNPSSPDALANRVVGATAYGLYDSDWYGEIGSYTSLPQSTQSNLGYALSGDPGRLSDTGFFRFAYMKDLKKQFFSAGIVALTAKRQLPRSGPADDLTDLGYDVTYQYIGNRENIVQASFVDILEQRRYGSLPPSPFPGITAQTHGAVHDRTFTLTYTFLQTYGLTFSHLVSTGTRDIVRYQPYGVPDTTSNLLTLYWAPFGKDDSFTTIANLKLAATWFHFSRFNGSSTNIFGVGPGLPVTNAHDLNAFSLTASLAF